jgi:hypothetical protein
VAQLQDAVGRVIDEDGSLEIKTEGGSRAAVVHRVPVEGEYLDFDGLPVFILLHVVGGYVRELEVWKGDGTHPQLRFPAASVTTKVATSEQ